MLIAGTRELVINIKVNIKINGTHAINACFKDISTLSKNLNVHVSQTYLEELERGRKKNPSFNIIETIATILCVNIDELRRIWVTLRGGLTIIVNSP